MFLSKTARLGEYKFAQTDLTRIDADGTFSGYASLFGAEDLGRDVLMPGAFKNSLVKQGVDLCGCYSNTIPMYQLVFGILCAKTSAVFM